MSIPAVSALLGLPTTSPNHPDGMICFSFVDVGSVCAGVHGHFALAQQPLEHESVWEQGLSHQHCPDGGLCGSAGCGRQPRPQWLQSIQTTLRLQPCSVFTIPCLHISACCVA